MLLLAGWLVTRATPSSSTGARPVGLISIKVAISTIYGFSRWRDFWPRPLSGPRLSPFGSRLGTNSSAATHHAAARSRLSSPRERCAHETRCLADKRRHLL